MPAHRGRPTVYDTKIASITFKIDEAVYADISRYAKGHGLSVPMYVAMMINCHRNMVAGAEAERAAAREAVHG